MGLLRAKDQGYPLRSHAITDARRCKRHRAQSGRIVEHWIDGSSYILRGQFVKLLGRTTFYKPVCILGLVRSSHNEPARAARGSSVPMH